MFPLYICFLLTTFYDFLTRHFKKRKKPLKKRKIRILERCARLQLVRVMTAVISQSVCEPVCVRVRVRVR